MGIEELELVGAKTSCETHRQDNKSLKLGFGTSAFGDEGNLRVKAGRSSAFGGSGNRRE